MGVGSRRQVEAWIVAGRITVNGKLAAAGQPVGERDDVRLDGRRLRLDRDVGQAPTRESPTTGRRRRTFAAGGRRDALASSMEKLPKAARQTLDSRQPARSARWRPRAVRDRRRARCGPHQARRMRCRANTACACAAFRRCTDRRRRCREAAASAGLKVRSASWRSPGGEGTQPLAASDRRRLAAAGPAHGFRACGLEAEPHPAHALRADCHGSRARARTQPGAHGGRTRSATRAITAGRTPDYWQSIVCPLTPRLVRSEQVEIGRDHGRGLEQAARHPRRESLARIAVRVGPGFTLLTRMRVVSRISSASTCIRPSVPNLETA